MIIKNTRKEDNVQKPFIISCGRHPVNDYNLQISGMNFPRDLHNIIIKVSGRLKGKTCCD
ncbi:MAG: hypothetical protein PHX78_05350 [bacterium]|nr:hypothetical protein [bacterium]